MKKYHLKSSFAIRAALVAAAVAVHSASADTPDELLDYVQTDGSAYIDTGIIGKTGTKASIGMMWHNGGGTKDVCFLGARNGSNGRFLLSMDAFCFATPTAGIGISPTGPIILSLPW